MATFFHAICASLYTIYPTICTVSATYIIFRKATNKHKFMHVTEFLSKYPHRAGWCEPLGSIKAKSFLTSWGCYLLRQESDVLSSSSLSYHHHHHHHCPYLLLFDDDVLQCNISLVPYASFPFHCCLSDQASSTGHRCLPYVRCTHDKL
jgi:hypothetical protein